jgi:hypothetical protein
MKRTRRTAAELYPKLPTYAQALARYQNTPQMRGHKESRARPLSSHTKAFPLWRLCPTSSGIACVNGNTPIITYHVNGWIQITPTPTSIHDLAIIRAVAPVDSVRWDYYRNCLVVYRDGERHTCQAGDIKGIWLPPTA